MMRLDVSSPLAEVSDFVLELAQPDGTTARVCVSTGGEPISLTVFLSTLAQKGVIARGGGNPARAALLATQARQRGLLLKIDRGGHPNSPGDEYAGLPGDEDLDAIAADRLADPFEDYPGGRSFAVENGEVCYVAPVSGAAKKRGKHT